jgi:uncharacterized protein (TIGR00369 family)
MAKRQKLKKKPVRPRPKPAKKKVVSHRFKPKPRTGQGQKGQKSHKAQKVKTGKSAAKTKSAPKKTISQAANKKRPPAAAAARPKPLTKPVLSRPVASEAAPRLVPVPLPEGVRPQRLGEPNERSAHLEKLKQLFESAPISRYLGMTLGYCENGVARVRLPFRKDFEEGHGVIHGGLIGLLGDTAGNFAVGSVSPGSTVKTVEFKLSLLAGVQGDLLAIGEVVRKGRTLATCRLEVVEGNDRVIAIGLATYALQAV